MAKLKSLIKQLAPNEYHAIYDQLINSNAEKSAYLLKFIREKHMSDAKVMEELEVNTNAYYTLRSRLNQKIEEYLLQQMENPRTDLLKKVANISEIIFTKKRQIAIATLKKLEKELQDYDLSNELTIVYKALKKLHINTPDHYTYSQLYNKHVAYMLALDKAEDLVADYCRKYGNYYLTGAEVDRMGLDIITREIGNVANLYKAGHRFYVFQSMVSVFQRLFVEKREGENEEPIEDVLQNVERLFETYIKDSIYFNLNVVFEFLWLEYYNFYRNYRKAEKYFDELNSSSYQLMSNYSLFTFPAQFLISKIDRAIRQEGEHLLYDENKELFVEFESDVNDVPKHVIYVCYRALSCYFAGKYEEAARYLNNLLNEMSLKRFPQALMEVKLLLALQYCLMAEYDLFNQTVNSIQRQVRINENENLDHVQLFIKLMKVSMGENRKTKEEKIKQLVAKIDLINPIHFSAIKHIKMDDKFVTKLC